VVDTVLESAAPLPHAKPPQAVLEGLWLFSPNRDTLGGSSWLLNHPEGNGLVDVPAFAAENLAFLDQQGGLSWIFLTHRTNFGRAQAFQERFGCELIVQEQEAYLLPEARVTAFQQDGAIALATPIANLTALWTCGHTPGSSCLYWTAHGGVLFTGRHLLPTPQGELEPVRISKTFHWPRQLRSIQALADRFTPESLFYACPGASLGLLRGALTVEAAGEKLQRCAARLANLAQRATSL
jgi:glyoxylase-like metal-dependent hydrolase (beta-lactamase superfamily II)